jgi:hypothetical protein
MAGGFMPWLIRPIAPRYFPRTLLGRSLRKAWLAIKSMARPQNERHRHSKNTLLQMTCYTGGLPGEVASFSANQDGAKP